MNITIRPTSANNAYNLYVDNHIAVSHESMTVCLEIKSALEIPLTGHYYSEAAEIGYRIEQYFNQ